MLQYAATHEDIQYCIILGALRKNCLFCILLHSWFMEILVITMSVKSMNILCHSL